MNYQHITTKEVKTYSQIKQLNKNVSYPMPGAETLGVVWKLVAETPKPVYNEATEGVREIAPVAYAQVWEVYALTQPEIDAIQAETTLRTRGAKWRKYQEDKLAHEKSLWIAAGRPTFTP